MALEKPTAWLFVLGIEGFYVGEVHKIQAQRAIPSTRRQIGFCPIQKKSPLLFFV